MNSKDLEQEFSIDNASCFENDLQEGGKISARAVVINGLQVGSPSYSYAPDNSPRKPNDEDDKSLDIDKVNGITNNIQKNEDIICVQDLECSEENIHKPICGGVFFIEDGNITIDPHAYDNLNPTTKSPISKTNNINDNSLNITGINANFEHVVECENKISDSALYNTYSNIKINDASKSFITENLVSTTRKRFDNPDSPLRNNKKDKLDRRKSGSISRTGSRNIIALEEQKLQTSQNRIDTKNHDSDTVLKFKVINVEESTFSHIEKSASKKIEKSKTQKSLEKEINKKFTDPDEKKPFHHYYKYNGNISKIVPYNQELTKIEDSKRSKRDMKRDVTGINLHDNC